MKFSFSLEKSLGIVIILAFSTTVKLDCLDTDVKNENVKISWRTRTTVKLSDAFSQQTPLHRGRKV